ncbi:DegT/DnrJ/EryC1/StrS family aminotransferase [Chlorobium phaeovibrioides]|uniref:Aminotransferase class I/II-fold pyridoxal phosphate-dependent enzyme n=1 Tax=Chlorobium phaeovibrioides TaxID=1094 RepID=A0ABW9UP43_CHLPH|nr:DegT/DnrJ/EryC1/StrS family aminotransferase [Chlorobium phaeovibrioides]MWV54820.1 aminotransferase class I/II-fold pyridoxal phosphate-dependent enzyme [Chlorobium phaeovibrioides]
MQFIDLITQKDRIRGAVMARLESIVDRAQFIMGAEVAELESQLAAFAGTRHCLSCSSGTDALLIALMAKGIGPGDAVLTTPFTFVATAEVVSLTGATPVFVDIDPVSFNIDPDGIADAVKEAEAKGLRPKALIPVDLFGLPADYDRLESVARNHGLWILEDACQGFGGALNGRKAGSFGLVGATSFFPAKPLGCWGDGGAIFTDDDELAELMISVRVHGGGADKYSNVRIGINGRLDAMQAAVLLEKLTIFDEELLLRDRVANAYSKRLAGRVQIPVVPEGYSSAWAQYSVLASDSAEREQLMAALQKEGIPSVIYYKIPLHLQGAYADLGYRAGDFPITEDISSRIFSLPMHPYLKESEIELVCSALLA